MATSLHSLQYPIGPYQVPEPVTESHLKTWIAEIESLPGLLETALDGMTEEQLDTPYRPGGWTVRQLVHHIADSHINSHCRIRLALTEEKPFIKPYEQDRWVRLADAETMPIHFSLDIIRNIHARWVFLLKSLDESQFKRTFVHPEYGEVYTIEKMTGLYAWHGRHHLAHITGLKQRNGW
jgi:hypothetical protein